MTKTTNKIVIELQKCSSCLRCQLICSLVHGNEFNPSQSNIKIDEDDYGVANIYFSDECDGCDLCVSYCLYGALKIREETK